MDMKYFKTLFFCRAKVNDSFMETLKKVSKMAVKSFIKTFEIG